MINVGRPMIGARTAKTGKKLRTEHDRDNASHGCHNPRCNNPEHIMTTESFANNNKRTSHNCGGYVETAGGNIYTLDHCQCVTRCPKVMKLKDENLLVRGDQNWTEKDHDKYCYAHFVGLPCNHLLPIATTDGKADGALDGNSDGKTDGKASINDTKDELTKARDQVTHWKMEYEKLQLESLSQAKSILAEKEELVKQMKETKALLEEEKKRAAATAAMAEAELAQVVNEKEDVISNLTRERDALKNNTN